MVSQEAICVALLITYTLAGVLWVELADPSFLEVRLRPTCGPTRQDYKGEPATSEVLHTCKDRLVSDS